MKFVVRHNQLEHVWKVVYENNYFEQPIFVRGTEDEMREYMESEFGYVGKYHACNDQQVDYINKLRLKIYIAPQLR